MDESKLILLVQQYEELYNLRHKHYSNQQRRSNIWNEIGKLMNERGNTCRERWVRIRDNHRKALKLRMTKSGQAATNLKPPKYSKELTFLATYLFDEEERTTNIGSINNTQQDDETDNDNDDNDENAVSPENLHEETADLTSPGTPSSTISDMSAAIAGPSRLRQQLKTRVSNKKQLTAAPSAAIVLQTYLNEKRAEKRPAADSVTNFFVNMAETVKTFPIVDQINIKKALFEMVTQVEMRAAVGETTSHKTSNNSRSSCNPQYKQIVPNNNYGKDNSHIGSSTQLETYNYGNDNTRQSMVSTNHYDHSIGIADVLENYAYCNDSTRY